MATNAATKTTRVTATLRMRSSSLRGLGGVDDRRDVEDRPPPAVVRGTISVDVDDNGVCHRRPRQVTPIAPRAIGGGGGGTTGESWIKTARAYLLERHPRLREFDWLGWHAKVPQGDYPLSVIFVRPRGQQSHHAVQCHPPARTEAVEDQRPAGSSCAPTVTSFVVVSVRGKHRSAPPSSSSFQLLFRYAAT
jgi:hypothetical protein